VIESIGVEKKTLNPNGLVFFSAQPVSGLAAAATAQDAVIVQVTCFVPDVNQVDHARTAVTSAFPGASANFIQPTRLALDPATSCEGIGRLQKPGKSPARLVFTKIQMAFGDQDQDLRLAYGRLGRALESMKADPVNALAVTVYSLNGAVGEKAAGLYPGRPVKTIHVVEGLPSLDATVAIELVAPSP
jgi:enamine deaminase RidA (YjgF/YER057c/UK114 family)